MNDILLKKVKALISIRVVFITLLLGSFAFSGAASAQSVLLKFSTLTPGDSDLSFPLAITVDAQGRIIVAENSDTSS